MPAHAKEIDKRERYTLFAIWAMIVMAGVGGLMLTYAILTFGNVWVGVLTGIAVLASSARLVVYTRDLIKATA